MSQILVKNPNLDENEMELKCYFYKQKKKTIEIVSFHRRSNEEDITIARTQRYGRIAYAHDCKRRTFVW